MAHNGLFPSASTLVSWGPMTCATCGAKSRLSKAREFTKYSLKGQCHEIFCFRFFSWIVFPLAHENKSRVISNFFENSRRYLQVKVHHRYQQHRRQILPPVPLVLLIPVAKLLAVSTILAANLPLRWCILNCEYLRKVSKKSETAQMVYSGAWRKLIQENNLKSKISWHCPFNRT